MSAVVIDVDHGTPERVWEQAGLASLPPLQIGPPTSVLAVAPHPDDEVLGVGGLLRLLHRAGHRIEVLAVTDGEASHPGSAALSPAQLAARRRIEATQARRELGLRPAPADRLGLPDGAVAGHEDELSAVIAGRIDAGSIVLATWRSDGHPDHEAVGRAAAAATAAVGARLVEYPVWMWNWAQPDDPRIPWATARSVALPRATHQAKHRAMRAFRTQLTPIGPHATDGPVLPDPVIAHHRRPFEVVLA